MIIKDEYDTFDGYVDALEDRVAELESRLAQREADCIHNIEEHARLGSRLGERITELEDTCLSLETELASQVAANQILADMDAKTYAENQRLRAGLSEALDWNWLDDDAPDDSHLRALLGGGENG